MKEGACMAKRGMHGEGYMCDEGVVHGKGGLYMAKGSMCGKRGACMAKGGHAWLQGGVHGIRRYTINERAVHILLECILVFTNELFICSRCVRMTVSVPVQWSAPEPFPAVGNAACVQMKYL